MYWEEGRTEWTFTSLSKLSSYHEEIEWNQEEILFSLLIFPRGLSRHRQHFTTPHNYIAIQWRLEPANSRLGDRHYNPYRALPSL